MQATIQPATRRSLFTRIDRRILRSVIYTVATLLLLVLFKSVEWLFEHWVSNGSKVSLPFAFGATVAMAIVLQVSHKRFEEAVAHWVNRVAHTREHELRELAKEVPLIRDAQTLAHRVVTRLDQILGRTGSSLYVRKDEDHFALVSSAPGSMPEQVRCDDPAVIHAMLHHAAVVPASRGSTLSTPMIWPIEARGHMEGFIALGESTAPETLDDFQGQAISALADSVGNCLALLQARRPVEPLALPDKPSIAVLPFDDLSESSEQAYFADGAVEEITMALSQYRGLFVIARNSSFAYKGRAVDVKQIGRELGVRYLVEGSVRKSGDNLRITAQLIDTTNGAHLWADRVDGAVHDVFALQERVTTAVVGAILPTLEQAEIRRVCGKPTENLDAYEQYVRGLSVMYQLQQESNERALRFFRKAIDLDGAYGLALARAAECYAIRRQAGWMVDLATETDEGCRLARRAVEVARDDPLVLAVSGFVLAYVGGELELGDEYIARSLTLSSNVAEAWASSAWTRTCFGDVDMALDHAAKAMRLSPLDPRAFRWKMVMARAHLFAGRYEDAAEWAAKSLADQPNFMAGLRVCAAANAHAGRMDVARAAVARLLQRDPSLRLSTLARTSAPYRGERNRTIIVDGLRMAGLPE